MNKIYYYTFSLKNVLIAATSGKVSQRLL